MWLNESIKYTSTTFRSLYTMLDTVPRFNANNGLQFKSLFERENNQSDFTFHMFSDNTQFVLICNLHKQ